MQTTLPLADNVFSVTQITELISEILVTSFKFITIEGEISNWRPSSAGHIYFTLKDDTSQIRAVMFRGAAYGLSFRPKDGDKVRCTGSISVYAPQGNYQIIVSKMEASGSGNILQMIEERKKKLNAEGLFSAERKKKLPSYPDTVGVVTSPTGAAIRDILNIAKRRNPSVNIRLFPAIVQGDEAAQTIVKMIETANFYNLCDVLIVGRGGGSLEDLLPFSEESVVRAVAASRIPVISAVGHDIDWALCDYAADVRAATPSAAAELAIPLKTEIYDSINTYKKELFECITRNVETKRLLIRSFTPDSFETRFRTIQQPLLNRFDNARQQLKDNMNKKINDTRTFIQNSRIILENASPQTIFNRGYSMVTDAEGNIIRSASQVAEGNEIHIKPSQGEIKARVIQSK